MPQVPSELHLGCAPPFTSEMCPWQPALQRSLKWDAILRVQAKALVWQEQVEVLTQALQQANAEKAVLAADKGRLEQEVANLRLQLSVIQKAMEAGQLARQLAPAHARAACAHAACLTRPPHGAAGTLSLLCAGL